MSDDLINIQENADLIDFNTMGVHADAKYFLEANSISDLQNGIQFSKKNETKLLILGGGSNILFLDDFEGMVIVNRIPGKEIVDENDDEVIVKAGAGVNWHELVQQMVEKGWGGIENLSLIPGTVGAAPIQNIGAYGVELADVFIELEALNLKTLKPQNFSKAECKFGYRDSIFKSELKGEVVITSVTLKLKKNPEVNISYKSLNDKLKEDGVESPDISHVMEAVIEVRQSKLPDPEKIGNTGSFFKNPVISVYQYNQLKSELPDLPSYSVSERQVKVPAGWLIDHAGWKGYREGDAGVHEKQALVLVNYGDAKGIDIWNLALKIQKNVKEQYEIDLIPEVNIIGN